MDDALAGTRVLIAGGDGDAARELGTRLAAGAAQVTLAADAEAAAQAALTGSPDVIVALGAAEAELRELLDPLGLRSGPQLVDAADLDAPLEDGDRGAVRRLRELLDRSALERRARELESALAALTVGRRRDLDTLRVEMLQRLALAAEYRDDNTREHTERVAALAARLGQRLGLSELAVTHIRHAAPLHDVGKIAIPDSILLKPGRLSAAEFEVVKTHAEAGARVLAEADSELLEVAESIARSHHERWDGGGYPDALAGRDIPLVGRLVHVADVFDVLVHERPYKDAFSVEDAAEEITGGAGSQFDPEVIEAFTDLGPRVWLAAPGIYGG
ncbi:MAG: HD domain-containing phosphohydrolase [Solirubrobacteraceae bacterium]